MVPATTPTLTNLAHTGEGGRCLASSGDTHDDCGLLVDGDLHTSWGWQATRLSQGWVAISVASMAVVSGVRVQYTGPPFPRLLVQFSDSSVLTVITLEPWHYLAFP